MKKEDEEYIAVGVKYCSHVLNDLWGMPRKRGVVFKFYLIIAEFFSLRMRSDSKEEYRFKTHRIFSMRTSLMTCISVRLGESSSVT